MPDTFRILVTGSRHWPSADAVWDALKQACDEHGPDNVLIVHGAAAKGADAMAARYAEQWGIRTEVHRADWQKHGRAAGMLRNAEMIALGAELVLAFVAPCDRVRCRHRSPHGSHGTEHCASLAEKAGLPVKRFTP